MSRHASSLEALALARGFRVRLADGCEFGADEPRFVVALRSNRLLVSPAGMVSPLTLGRAWIEGHFDIEGDLFAAMAEMQEAASALPGPAIRLLGVVRSALRPWRDARRDIASHYDLPVEFFSLFLDESLIYTCAYYRDEATSLEEAQRCKLDLVCRKLRLEKGQSLLDVGCGWGGLALHAAREYGVRVLGITLSAEQAKWASARAEREGLVDRVRIEPLDWRRLPRDARYDRVASVGMIEHVGLSGYARYFGCLREMLPDDGLALVHGITRRDATSWSSGMEFLDRHVFPGLELVEPATIFASMEDAGLEVIDVENLRPHYARTTREWATRLWVHRDDAVRIAGERAWRTWVGYLAAASVCFEAGWIGLHQFVAAPAGRRDDGTRPRLREDAYR